MTLQPADQLIRWNRCRFNALPLPRYQDDGIAGFDLQACLTNMFSFSDHPVLHVTNENTLIRTGFAAIVPDGYELQLHWSANLALGKDRVILNPPGTVTATHRGEIVLQLAIHNACEFTIPHGMVIARAAVVSTAAASHSKTLHLQPV